MKLKSIEDPTYRKVLQKSLGNLFHGKKSLNKSKNICKQLIYNFENNNNNSCKHRGQDCIYDIGNIDAIICEIFNNSQPTRDGVVKLNGERII